MTEVSHMSPIKSIESNLLNLVRIQNKINQENSRMHFQTKLSILVSRYHTQKQMRNQIKVVGAKVTQQQERIQWLLEVIQKMEFQISGQDTKLEEHERVLGLYKLELSNLQQDVEDQKLLLRSYQMKLDVHFSDY